MTSRYFVIWCLEDTIAEALDAPSRHGEIVGAPKVLLHPNGAGYSSSAEVALRSVEERSSDAGQG